MAILMLIPFIKLSAQCAQLTNIYSFTYNGKQYEVVKEMKTWEDAANCAVERGGYLVEINDQNEQNAVYNGILSAGVSPTYTSIANGGGIAYVWIGAADQANEGTWLWDGNNDNTGLHFWTGQGSNGTGNGSAVGSYYNNWGGSSTVTPKEPDNFGAGQHHAAIGLAGWPSGTTMLGIAGEWNDIIGSSLLYFVIELNSGTGINDINNQNGIKAFPNPCNEILFVEYNNTKSECDYEIYDMSGRLMAYDKLNANQEINILGLNTGMYYLKIKDKFSSNIIKFIKE